VRDHRRLHGLEHVEVEPPVPRAGRDEVGNDHHRDLVGDHEAADAGAVGLVALEVAARHLDRRHGAGLEVVAAGRRDALGQVDAAHVRGLHADVPRLGVHDGLDVAVALAEREVAERLDLPPAGQDLQRERGRRLALGRRRRLDRHLQGPAGLERPDLERLDLALGPGRERTRRRTAAAARVGDPAHVAGPAAVVEVAVHGVGKQRALDEPAVQALELRPVGDEARLDAVGVVGVVQRGPGGESDEGGNGGADALDGLRSAVDLLDVHPGRQIRGHGPSFRSSPAPCRRGLVE
jgi:hypothetical protein